jgi:hypothetical protein
MVILSKLYLKSILIVIPTMVKPLLPKLAASLVASLHLKNFFLEGDSSIMVTALQTPSITVDWHIESIIANTLSLLPSSSCWEGKKSI